MDYKKKEAVKVESVRKAAVLTGALKEASDMANRANICISIGDVLDIINDARVACGTIPKRKSNFVRLIRSIGEVNTEDFIVNSSGEVQYLFYGFAIQLAIEEVPRVARIAINELIDEIEHISEQPIESSTEEHIEFLEVILDEKDLYIRSLEKQLYDQEKYIKSLEMATF